MHVSKLAASCLTFAVAALAAAQDAKPTMKAVRIHEFGGPEKLVYEDVPRPEPQAGQVLVRVYAASVNPVDWKIRDGMFRAFDPRLPQPMGFDVSGVVESVGKGVERFKAGDAVFSYLPISNGGAYAEYVVAPETAVAAKPKSLDHVHAAAVPLAALTAWQALFDNAGLKEGQTVLIHAGSGGVGHFAVQLAKAKGAKVIATSSEKNLAFLKELGADQTIDYKTQKFEELVKDVDVVLDPIGGDTLARSYQVVKAGGFVVSIVEPPAKEKLDARGIRGAVFLVQPNAKELAEIGALIEAGKVKPVVSETYPLADARKAQESNQTGHTRGKIVLVVAK